MIKNLTWIILTITIVLLKVQILVAQTMLPKVIYPSPQASSIGKYGEIPVNLSSGLPNVDIPLMNINEGFLNLPISLSYNYSGFKPSDQPGIVGLGWALKAGGVITRIVKDIPDEKNSFNGKKGYLYSSSAVKNLLNLDGSLNCSGDLCPSCFSQGLCDGEPDIFYFSFGQYSGKFFFGDDGLPHIVSDKKMKIDYSIINTSPPVSNGSFDNIYGFIITADDGTIYRFGDPSKTISEVTHPIKNVEFSYSQSSSPKVPYSRSESVISSWYLKEIEDTYGNIMKFIYTNDYKSTAGGDIKENRRRVSQSLSTYYIAKNSGNLFYDFDLINTNNVSSENLLTQIIGTNWVIDMGYDNFNSNSLHNLNGISLSKSNGILIKKYVLKYSNNLKYPLLEELKTISINESVNEIYSFNYYNDGVPTNTNVYDIDYWGYYNGANNTELIPVAPYNSNRLPNFLNTVLGTLKTIIYPTGGATTFEYEQNQYSYIREKTTENGINIGKKAYGGIRLRRLVDSSSFSPSVVKVYNYDSFDNPNISSGVALAPINNYFLTLDVTIPALPWPQNSTATSNYKIYKSDPFNSISLTPIYYFNVRETIGGLIRTDHSFTSHLDYPDNLGINYGIGDNQIGPSTSYDFARSLPKSTKFYNNNSIISESETTYAVSIRHMARTLWTQNVLTVPELSFQFAKGLVTLSGLVQKKSETTKTYSPAPITSVVNYTIYDPVYLTLEEKSYLNSKGETMKTSFRYPQDFVSSGNTSTSNPLSYMIGKNIISKPIEIIESISKGSENNIISAKIIQYGSVASGKFVSPVFEGRLKLIAPIPFVSYKKANIEWNGTVENFKVDSLISYDINYSKYDDKGNILEYRNPSHSSNIYSSIIRGYNNQYIVAELTGADYETVTSLIDQSILNNPNLTDLAIRTELNKIRHSLSSTSVQVKTFTYKPLIGMTSETDSKGTITYYEYDDFNRIKSIKDHNGFILKNFCYNYKGNLIGCPVPGAISYSNTALSGNFPKSDCGSGFASGPLVLYTIPAGKHISYISKVHADQMALNDLNLNGPVNANLVGTCVALPSIGSPNLQCRTSGSCNDNFGCGVRYGVSFVNLNPVKSYSAVINNIGGTGGSASLSNFVRNGSTATAKINYYGSNASQNVTFDIILYENGIEVYRLNQNLSHNTAFSQIPVCE
ncbi:DUF5977 domain-containing protein [Daejeonella oryzae]|uniref:DUF5977 domain-containing protein n=1 Tax=Daejeonella oryzae TaxID=1122943 RepID=UPI000414E805|nr:DUF5977 domain-containing protein [Daejeonella oryzae]